MESLASFLEKPEPGRQQVRASKPDYLIRIEQLAEQVEPGSVEAASKLLASTRLLGRVLPVVQTTCRLLAGPFGLSSSKSQQVVLRTRKGGLARAASLSPERRREIALLGVEARRKKQKT